MADNQPTAAAAGPRPLRLFDRSRVTTDWTCQRRRLLAYEYDGRGLVNPHTSLELYNGTTVHDALATIGRSALAGAAIDINSIATVSAQQTYEALVADAAGDRDVEDFAHEQSALVEGLIRGFYTYQWPRLLADGWRVVCVEQEMFYDLPAAPGDRYHLRFMSRPDLVLADPTDGLWYVEYKTTGSKGPGWVNSWQTAIQLHSGIKAIEQTLGRPATGVIVQGLYKGYTAYGRQQSPFCYCYYKAAQPPFVREQLSYSYKAGLQRTPTWQLAGGLAAYVAGIPAEVLADQFPQAPPIFVKHDIVDRFFQQTAVREVAIADGVAAWVEASEAGDAAGAARILDSTFPQRFDQCNPVFGKPCMFRRICHGSAGTDPLTNGYAYRTPHHDAEIEQQAAGDAATGA